MITFDKPLNLNGAELREQLKAAGVSVSNDIDSVQVEDNKLLLKIATKDESKAAAVVQAHNGTVIAPELTLDQKLASVGLSVADLRTALGL